MAQPKIIKAHCYQCSTTSTWTLDVEWMDSFRCHRHDSIPCLPSLEALRNVLHGMRQEVKIYELTADGEFIGDAP